MAQMQLGLQHDPEMEPKRAKTLFISICIHIAIFGFLLLNPDLLVQTPKRFIRIGGQDYDLSKNQFTELVLPPKPQPKPQVPEKPLVQPPQPEPPPKQAAPPPPPPPPPPKETPVIPPNATIAEGARPDGSPKPSQGNTAELRTGTSGSPEPPKQAGQKAEPQKTEPPKIAQNTNPNALSLKDLAGKILQQSAHDQPRYPGVGTQGPRTGIPGPTVQENPDFSTEEPKILSPTYGYDFGPYLNQVINRIRYNWYSFIPEIAKFRKGRVVIIFRIAEGGAIVDPRIVANSGTDPLDRAAYASITASNPFPKLPSNFEGDHLDLQITFLYNINP